MKRFLIKLLAVTALVLGGFAAATAPANAAAPVGHAPTVTCQCDAPNKVNIDSFKKYLSSERWKDASGVFHGRFDEFLQSNLINQSQRQFMQGGVMASGNGAYSVGEGIIILAIDMSPIDALGEQMDHIAEAVGNALFSNGGATAGIIVAIVVWVVGVSLFQMRRGQKPWKKLIGTAVIVAFISILIGGAHGSTTVDGKFRPGLGSPGWFATKIDDTVSTIANIPATGILTVQNDATQSVAPEGTNCYGYMDNMTKWYGMANGGHASVPQILSGLWQDTGLTIWKESQYGVTTLQNSDVPAKLKGTTYGDNVFCHQLDWQAGYDAKTQMTMTFGGTVMAERAGFTEDSRAWGKVVGKDVSNSNDDIDRSLVAWAACRPNGDKTFTVDKGWSPKIKPEDCQKWASGDKKLDAFNVGGSSTEASNQFTDPAVVNFLWTLHGNDVGMGMILTYAYAISAWLVAIVFGGLGIAIAIAKFSALVMMVALIFVLMASLLTNQERGGKLVPFAKTYLGFSVLAFGANFILALIATLAHAFTQLGKQAFAQGDLMSIFWTGFSPLLAVILLHLVFTKVLKVPSVFNPSSAFAWGSMAGSVGASSAAAFTRRAEGRAGRLASSVGKKGLSLVTKGRAGTGKPGTGPGGKGGAGFTMKPKGGNGGTGTKAPNTTKPRRGERPTGEDAVLSAFDLANQVNGMSAKEMREAGIDKKALRNARAFIRKDERGDQSRLGAIAQNTTARSKASAARARQMLAYMKQTDVRASSRRVADAAMKSTRQSWSATKTAAQYFKADPRAATRHLAGVAAQAGAATVAGTVTAAKATAAGARAVAESPVTRVAVPTAIGMALGGPAGAVLGASIAAPSAARARSRQNARAAARQIVDYTERMTAPSN
jgi:hypothetical protein